MNILDPVGIFKQQKAKDIMKETAFKMKGYSYPGISPIKKDIPVAHYQYTSSTPSFVSQEVLDANAYEKEKIVKKNRKTIKRKENIKKAKTKIEEFAETEVGQAVISGAVLAPKPQKETTRIISKDWKIIS